MNHWDTAIRELTSKTIYKLTAREPTYTVTEVLPKLFLKTASIDVNERHGSILAIGEIIAMLRQLEIDSHTNGKYIGIDLTKQLNELIGIFQKRDQFKGLSGEMMFQSSCEFIRNCSIAKIETTEECIGMFIIKIVIISLIFNKRKNIFLDSWQSVIDACLVKNSTPLRDSAIGALTELCKSYYNKSERTQKIANILANYLIGSKEDLWEFVRMGYVSAIGALPNFMLQSELRNVLLTLMAHSLTPADRKEFFADEPIPTESHTVNNWAEARRDSVKALINVIQTVGFDEIIQIHLFDQRNALEKIFQCFLLALQEYTNDNRGDIGAWVREAAMNALYKLITSIPHNLLEAEKVHAIVTGLAQQAVEKIDRTRALAGKLFCKIIYL